MYNSVTYLSRAVARLLRAMTRSAKATHQRAKTRNRITKFGRRDCLGRNRLSLLLFSCITYLLTHVPGFGAYTLRDHTTFAASILATTFTFSLFDWIAQGHAWESQGLTRALAVDVELPVMYCFSQARGYLLFVSSSSVDPGVLYQVHYAHGECVGHRFRLCFMRVVFFFSRVGTGGFRSGPGIGNWRLTAR